MEERRGTRRKEGTEEKGRNEKINAEGKIRMNEKGGREGKGREGSVMKKEKGR